MQALKLTHVQARISTPLSRLFASLVDAKQSKLQCNLLEHHDYFDVRKLVSMNELFENRVHLGHKIGLRNEHMTPFIYGARFNMDIINLEHTKSHLQDALNVLAHIAYRNGVILFLTRHQQSSLLVERCAREVGEYAHCRPWKSGSLTNSTQMYGAVTRLPDLCVFTSTHDTVFETHKAVIEAARMNVMSIGVVDTSADPRPITYPIPGNDDTMDAVKLYLRLFKEAVLRGKRKRLQDFGEPQTGNKTDLLDDVPSKNIPTLEVATAQTGDDVVQSPVS